MPLTTPVLEELRRVVGRESVIDSANDLRIFERDASIEGALPDAVVLASTTAEVAGVIKVAAKHRIPVVPRGAGTGLSGGAVTIRGGIALQVTRMRGIEIDPVAQTALVEPGVVNQELSLVAASHGLFYAPDPSSQKACTIGGNAAENSGGPHCLYYGVTTNHVLGMEVVLADGSVHWVSGDAPDRIGLDLCGVLVGSEGTLCAITKVKVRLEIEKFKDVIEAEGVVRWCFKGATDDGEFYAGIRFTHVAEESASKIARLRGYFTSPEYRTRNAARRRRDPLGLEP